MWSFWRQKIGSATRKQTWEKTWAWRNSILENGPREQASRTGLEKNAGLESKATKKTGGCTLGYITAGCNLAGSFFYYAPRYIFISRYITKECI
jgi:hypothetical protein